MSEYRSKKFFKIIAIGLLAHAALTACGPQVDYAALAAQYIPKPGLSCVPDDPSAVSVNGRVATRNNSVKLDCTVEGEHSGRVQYGENLSQGIEVKVGGGSVNEDGSKTYNVTVKNANETDGNTSITFQIRRCQTSVMTETGDEIKLPQSMCSEFATEEVDVGFDTTPPSSKASVKVREGDAVTNIEAEDQTGVNTIKAGKTQGTLTEYEVTNGGTTAIIREIEEVGENKVYYEVCDPLGNCATGQTDFEYDPFAGVAARAVYDKKSGKITMLFPYVDPTSSLDSDQTAYQASQEWLWPLKRDLDCITRSNDEKALKVICEPKRKKDGRAVFKITVYDKANHKRVIEVPVEGLNPIGKREIVALITSVMYIVGSLSFTGISVQKELKLRIIDRQFDIFLEKDDIAGMERLLNESSIRHPEKKRKLIQDKKKLVLIKVMLDEGGLNLNDAFELLEEMSREQPSQRLADEYKTIMKIYVIKVVESFNNGDLDQLQSLMKKLTDNKKFSKWFGDSFNSLLTDLREQQPSVTGSKEIKNVVNEMKVFTQGINIFQQLIIKGNEYLLNDNFIKEIIALGKILPSGSNEVGILVNMILAYSGASDIDLALETISYLKKNSIYDERDNLWKIAGAETIIKTAINKIKNDLDQRFESILNEVQKGSKVDQTSIQGFWQYFNNRYHMEDWRSEFTIKIKSMETLIKKQQIIDKIKKLITTTIGSLKFLSPNIEKYLYMNDTIKDLFRNKGMILNGVFEEDFPIKDVESHVLAMLLLEFMPYAVLFNAGDYNFDTHETNVDNLVNYLDCDFFRQLKRNVFADVINGKDKDPLLKEIHTKLPESNKNKEKLQELLRNLLKYENDEIKKQVYMFFFKLAANLDYEPHKTGHNIGSLKSWEQK